MGYRNYAPANGFIVSKDGTGDFTTIASALSAATSGTTIFIKPGIYTENPTLKAGVNLTAWETDAYPPNVTINGKCSFSGAGTVAISGIELQTNSDFCLAITGSNASIIYIENCYINALNNTAISVTSSSSSSLVHIQNCFGNTATTGIAMFSFSGAGYVAFYSCDFSNTGGSTTVNTASGTGNLGYAYSTFSGPTTVSGTVSLTGGYSTFGGAGSNPGLTYNSTVSSSGCNFCGFDGGGTTSALSIGAGATLELDFADIASNATNAITGSGTLLYGVLAYTGTSSGNNVSTQTAIPLQPSSGGSSVVVQQIRASYSSTMTTGTITNSTTTPSTSFGSSIMSASITPTSSSHVLAITGTVNLFSSGNNFGCIYLIKNNTGNAVQTLPIYFTAAPGGGPWSFTFYVSAGTTSSTTYAIWAAGQTDGCYVNSSTTSSQYGGCTSSMLITEYTS